MKNVNMLTALTDNIVIDNTKCVACGECVERCILDNLRLKLPPCAGACPLGLNARGYVNLIARGEDVKALELVYKTLPFPGILGRVCSRPCEEDCHRNATGKSAVSIRDLKRYLADTVGKDHPYKPVPGADTGKKAAVVGAGPAGLMAAHDLRLKGHEVVLYDAEEEAGGMLRWGIPAFRLPVEIVRAEINAVLSMGITFEGGRRLGKDLRLAKLRDEFDAVILAAGCEVSKELNFAAGRDTIRYGLEFLRDLRAGVPGPVGKRVVVIGGGNVAVDAAQSALRLGAEEVTMVSLEAEDNLPAFPWAIEDARQEGVKLLPSWGPVRWMDDGQAPRLEFQRCDGVYDGEGRFNPCLNACETMSLEADTVIIAAGQAVDAGLFDGLALRPDGGPVYDELTLQNSVGKIFFAGDCVTGPSSVVGAMASGRRAAESADRFMAGEHLRYGRLYDGPVLRDYEIDVSGGVSTPRAEAPRRRFSGAGDFREIEGALTPETARQEARRCYSCGGPFGMHRTCWFCLPCEVECPEEALRVEIPYLLR